MNNKIKIIKHLKVKGHHKFYVKSATFLSNKCAKTCSRAFQKFQKKINFVSLINKEMVYKVKIKWFTII